MIVYATPIIYWITLCFVCFHAFRHGGKDEYVGAMIFIGGSIGTLIVIRTFGSAWTGVTDATFIVDVIALLALIHLTLTSDRFWPIWATAFHLLTISVHVATSIAPEITPWAFATGAAFWAYPMLLSLFLGVREFSSMMEFSSQSQA